MDNQSPELFGQTPSQTVGPFFHYSLPWKGGADLVGASDMGARPELFPPAHDLLSQGPEKADIAGQVIIVQGRVLDGAGEPVPDAMIEIWQANEAGRYASPDDTRADGAPDLHFTDSGFIGFGRAATGQDGLFQFRTIRPGPVPARPGGNSLQAPHIAIGVFGRGLIKRLVTRLYFADAAENDHDPVLARVPPSRRATLIAQPRGEHVWHLDIVLQGEGETVFFDV